ncbi:MAG: hypothetical protein IJC75_00020 [Oscillospiraceae bacterium]|nr:hypothetical protein [Oscillospiraceae bacterium]
MKPIPKELLLHTATLQTVTQDAWQSDTITNTVTLTKIRVEPSAKLVSDKQGRQITLSAALLYDCRSSRPKGVQFSQGQRILFEGKQYTIELIEPMYDGRRLHHYELGLTTWQE